ncbi:MAG: hypothetical protein KH431_04270 [Erysipelotrichaceae bacterium]|nr:hypothetical protein [Erysipelotrichaceae bacterium]
MKRICMLAVITLLISGFTGCTQTDKKPKDEHKEQLTEKQTDTNVLVAYFSNTGTTEVIAEMIADETQGTLYEIQPENSYTEEDLNYQDTDSRSSREQADSSIRPKILKSIDHMEAFDVIFLGYPIWMGDAPKIIYTFLESYDFSQKQIIPFCTSGSSDITSSAEVLKALVPNAKWLSGRRFSKESSPQDVQKWISALTSTHSEDKTKAKAKLYLKIDNHVLEADLIDHASTQALLALLKEHDLTISMRDFNGFEKVGEIGTTLPRTDESLTTKAGDLILYEGNQFVIYYDVNTWKLTKLGEIKNCSENELKSILGKGEVNVTLSLSKN